MVRTYVMYVYLYTAVVEIPKYLGNAYMRSAPNPKKTNNKNKNKKTRPEHNAGTVKKQAIQAVTILVKYATR